MLGAAENLSRQGIEATVLRLLTASPLPVGQIRANLAQGQNVIVLEETLSGCGVKEALAYALPEKTVRGVDVGGQYVTHGSISELYRIHGLDAASVAAKIREVLKVEN